MVSFKDDFIETELYTKPTGKHQYYFILSCHRTHKNHILLLSPPSPLPPLPPSPGFAFASNLFNNNTYEKGIRVNLWITSLIWVVT